MTQWDKIVSGKELLNAKNERSKTYISKKERRIALSELIEEGWAEFKSYKDPKFVGVKRDKPFDEIFEDKVWMLFANLGFTDMNCDRTFRMQYDYQNADITQQIDVFAADDETVLIVECKAAEKIKDGTFKKPIEAFYAQMEGLRKETQKRFPGRKVKFIWATHNYIINKPDLNKLNEWKIAYFNDAVIDYYSELVKHIGTCARYQLLGNLFANQEIKNMEDRIPAIQGKMGGHTYYSFSIEPERLLKISYVLHRNEANKNMIATYQRLIKKKRLNDVKTFIGDKGYFPNSLVISIDTKGKGVVFDPSPTKVEGSIPKLGILHLPKRYCSAYIIDGQHRLYGYSDSPYASTNSIPVVAFVDLDSTEQIKLFMDINENQKAVPKSLRVILNGDMLWDSENFNKQRQALCSKLAQMLGEEETSPLQGRIAISEEEQSSVRCITVSAVQAALKKCDFFSTFGKKNIVVKDGTFDLGTNRDTIDNIYPFMEECMRYIKSLLEEEWEKGENNNGILIINRGIQGIIRVINDIINLLVKTNRISPKLDKTTKVFDEVKYYLDPLVDFFANLTSEKRKALRSILGGGADTKYWRTFQKAIADQRTDFAPEGLEKYWEDEAKTYNEASRRYLLEIEKMLKDLIASHLEKVRGDKWLIIGLPKAVYLKAKEEADSQNYENIANGINSDNINIWDCINLIDCKEIVSYGKNWSEIFDNLVTRPEEAKLSGGKESKTEWINRLNTISNKLLKPSYSVSKDESDFIIQIYKWLSTNDI